MSEQVVGIFENITPKYDRLNRILSLGRDQSWRRRAVERLVDGFNGAPIDRLLDGCTGTGDLALVLAETAEVGEIVGVDASKNMLAQARKKTADAGHGEAVRFLEEDMFDLPFPDDYFDALTISFGFRNLRPYERALEEMLRVLRPGGRIVILEFAPPGGGVKGFLYRLYLSTIPGIGRLVAGDRSAYGYLESSIRAFLSPEELLDLLYRHGVYGTLKEDLFFEGVYLYSGWNAG
ncbi:MAG TPA: ubiquinone/menaquinone biosynthesis methyltransferase [Sediminispirochaeta sp.]|nr:ubiquinone/menaquinone biosynthesis methyltransferase [Sediminispirochaeta sp.]